MENLKSKAEAIIAPYRNMLGKREASIDGIKVIFTKEDERLWKEWKSGIETKYNVAFNEYINSNESPKGSDNIKMFGQELKK